MTVYELIKELEKLPEDCEILIRNFAATQSAVIYDAEPIDGPEHCEDGTPVAWLQTE